MRKWCEMRAKNSATSKLTRRVTINSLLFDQNNITRKFAANSSRTPWCCELPIFGRVAEKNYPLLNSQKSRTHRILSNTAKKQGSFRSDTGLSPAKKEGFGVNLSCKCSQPESRFSLAIEERILGCPNRECSFCELLAPIAM